MFKRDLLARSLALGASVAPAAAQLLYSGKVAEKRGSLHDEMQAILGSHALLTNIVLASNTIWMHEVGGKLRRDGIPMGDDWLRRIGPAQFAHINFRGTLRFSD